MMRITKMMRKMIESIERFFGLQPTARLSAWLLVNEMCMASS